MAITSLHRQRGPPRAGIRCANHLADQPQTIRRPAIPREDPPMPLKTRAATASIALTCAALAFTA
ncbi:MAG: hypothetical protein AAF995_07045, partial [Planctomycetota bacterium]